MTDPRIQRSCQKLASALFELLQEGCVYPPPVNLVLERAGVARATFYSHFSDLDTLLSWEIDRVMDEIYGAIDWQSHAQDAPFSGRVVRAVLTQAREHVVLFRTLLTGAAGPIPIERFYSRFYEASLNFNRRRCAAQGHEPEVPLEVICSSISGQLIGVLRWMVVHDPQADIEQLVTWMRRIYSHGLSHLLSATAAPAGQ